MVMVPLAVVIGVEVRVVVITPLALVVPFAMLEGPGNMAKTGLLRIRLIACPDTGWGGV